MLKRLINKLKHVTETNFGKSWCPVCENKVNKFAPLPKFYQDNANKYGYKFSFDDAETLNHVAYTCPHCGASDRDRLYALFIQKKYKELSLHQGQNILEIAPSKPLTTFIKSLKNIQLRTADLMMKGVDDQVDITNMTCYKDETFDGFICSHVLEHVPDDIKAMNELKRILKVNGWGILMVPIVLAINDIDEDPTITDIAERWRRFGQDDHIRLYSKSGFVSRIKSSGFEIQELDIKYFGQDVFARCGISESSVLYVVGK